MQEQGSTLIIVAVSLAALLGFAGLTIDFGYYFYQKTRLQGLADATVLACAQFDCDSADDPLIKELTNPFDVPSEDIHFTRLDPCSDSIDDHCVAVNIQKQWQSFFVRMLGIPNMTVAVSAKAIGGTQKAEPVPVFTTTPVLMAIAEKETGISLKRSQGDGYNITGNIVSNSLTQPGISSNQSKNLVIKGDIYARNTPNIVKPASGYTTEIISTPMSDPCGAATFKNVTFCTDSGPNQCKTIPKCTRDGTHIVESGGYGQLDLESEKFDIGVGWVKSCTYVFNGVYTIRDKMSISTQGVGGGIETTNGAVFIFSDNAKADISIKTRTASALFGEGNTIKLKAPTSGDWKGILFYRQNGNFNFNAIDLGNGKDAVNLEGIVYAPNGTVALEQKGGSSRSEKLTIGNLYGTSIALEKNGNGPDLTIQPVASSICGSSTTQGSTKPEEGRRQGKSRLLE